MEKKEETMDGSINQRPWPPVRYKSPEIRTTLPNLRTDPFPVPVVSAAAVAGIVGFVAGVDQTAMTGTAVEPVAAAVERTAVVSDP